MHNSEIKEVQVKKRRSEHIKNILLLLLFGKTHKKQINCDLMRVMTN
jgi:hypothetical protein